MRISKSIWKAEGSSLKRENIYSRTFMGNYVCKILFMPRSIVIGGVSFLHWDLHADMVSITLSLCIKFHLYVKLIFNLVTLHAYTQNYIQDIYNGFLYDTDLFSYPFTTQDFRNLH